MYSRVSSPRPVRRRTRSGRRFERVGAQAPVHQQGDDLRVGQERAAVGVVGAQRDPPGVVDAEEPFQADRPLQGVDEVLVAVRDRHDAAAGLHLDVEVDPLPARQPGEEVPDRAVGRHARRLAEEDLADVDRHARVRVHVLGQRRPRREPNRLVFGSAGAVAVELDVRQVDAVAVERRERLQGRRRVARACRGSGRAGASGAASPVRRPPGARPVRIARGVTPKWSTASSSVDDVPRPLLPALDAAGVDHLDAVPLRRAEQPGDGVAEPCPARPRRTRSMRKWLFPIRTRNALSISGVSANSWWACRAASGGIAASTAVV